MGALSTIPYDQYQKLPPEKRSRILTDEEYARLTPSQLASAGLGGSSEGAPANFNGPVFPNPDHIQAHLDTDSAIPVTRLPNGVSFQKGNFSGSPQMDVSNPASAEIIPGMGRTIAAQMTPAASAQNSTAKTSPLNPLVAKVRAKYPGAYDDLDDAELTKRVLAKYPQYEDLARPDSPMPGSPTTQPEMKGSWLGTLEGGPTDTNPSGSKVPRSIMNAPDSLGDAIGGLTIAGTGAMAAAPVLRAIVPPIARIAAKHPMITSTLASEAISQARHLPGVGRFIPPFSEMLPFLLNGGKSEPEGAPEKILDATPENKSFAGGADEPPPQKILDATGENKPFAGGMDEAPAAPRAATAASLGAILSPIESTPTPASDPILTRLRQNAQAIREEEAARVPKPEEDLTDIGTRSVARAKTARGNAEPTAGSRTAETEDDFKTRLSRKADEMRARGEQPGSVTGAAGAKDAYPVKITYDEHGIPTAETDGRHRVIQAIENGQNRIQVTVDRGHGPVETTVDPKVLARQMGVTKESLAATDAQQPYRKGNLQPREQALTQ